MTTRSFFKIFLLVIFLFFFLPVGVFSQVCRDEMDCQNKIKEYEEKLVQLSQQKKTLSEELRYLDTQISLTTLKIQQTQQAIEKLEEEIGKISEKIDNINQSLDFLTQIFLKKIVEVYKRRQINFFDIFLDSSNAVVLNKRFKYLKIAQDNDQRMIVKFQKTKINFEEQKLLREDKKKELDNLKMQLVSQKKELNNQQMAKKRLLEITQNDEAVYQRLLKEAHNQLQSFKSFIRRVGGGVIPANGFGTGNDGWYYSQRDERWAYQKIGNSSEIILEVGCFITCIAMVMKKNGIDWTPSTIAGNPDYFFYNTAYMLIPSRFNPWPNGLYYQNISLSEIDYYLQKGIPVIVGVYAGNYGTHYVVLKGIEENDYIMHDPYYGPDKRFSDYYSRSLIFVAGVFN